MRKIFIIGSALALAGCVTTETAQFKPIGGQEAIVRDGNPALLSKKPHSIVLVRPAKREFQIGSRPVYVVGVMNAGPSSVLLTTKNITVQQTRDGAPIADLKVMTYEELVNEEKTRQVVTAVLVGVAAGANAYSASRAGYYNSSGTIYTPRGPASFRVSGYDPTAAAIAQTSASIENAAMINNAVETGQRNMAALEEQVLKDNTVMPGEWVGGQVHFAPPANDPAGKNYRISITVGSDVHEIDVSQGTAGS